MSPAGRAPAAAPRKRTRAEVEREYGESRWPAVERLIERYSNPGELVLDPFGGIGTTAYTAILKGRTAYTIELNSDYHRDAVSYCTAAENKVTMPTLFDLMGAA